MIINQMPVGTTATTPYLEFETTFDIPTATYHFDVSDVKNLIPLDSTGVYYLDSLMIASNISQEDFFAGTLDNVKIRIGTSKRKGERIQMFPFDFDVISLEKPIPVGSFFYSLDGNDHLTLALSGSIKQQLGMIGLSEVKIRVSAIIKRSNQIDFVHKVKKEWGQ